MRISISTFFMAAVALAWAAAPAFAGPLGSRDGAHNPVEKRALAIGAAGPGAPALTRHVVHRRNVHSDEELDENEDGEPPQKKMKRHATGATDGRPEPSQAQIDGFNNMRRAAAEAVALLNEGLANALHDGLSEEQQDQLRAVLRATQEMARLVNLDAQAAGFDVARHGAL